MADNSDDWLAGLAGAIPMAGGAMQWILGHPQDAANSPVKTGLEAVGYGAASTFTNAMSEFGNIAGPVMSGLSTIDPSQAVTKPVMGLLHDVGIGQQGDQWDTGLIGMAGDTFDKISRLATFASLMGNEGDVPPPDGSSYISAAWKSAFATGPNQIRFGEAMLAPADYNIVTDPQGLSKARNELNNSWWGSGASGALDMIQMAALDPTKGASRFLEAGRAAKYVAGPQEADRFANVLNDTMDAPHQAAAQQADQLRLQANGTEDTDQAEALRKQADDLQANVQTPQFPGGKLNNYAHALTPGVDLNDASVVGTQLASKAPFDNVTDTNAILNRIAPTLGMGGTAPRAGLPVVAEMYADAAKATTDTALQRQIKLNVDYALTGSQSAMQWLAKNYPTIAAKGQRTTSAPAEFSQLEDAIDAHSAAYNIDTPYGRTMGPSGPNPGAAFDLGQFINQNMADPSRAAELKAYGDAVQKFSVFRDMVEHGGQNGGPLEFGTSGVVSTAASSGVANQGVQVAPRALESLKASLAQKVADEYLYKTGPSGMTIRVINKFATDVAPNGYVNLVDPIQGGQQLANHMKEYQGSVDGLSGDVIKQTVDSFQRLDMPGRKQLVANVYSAMLSGLGAKYGLSADQTADVIAHQTDAVTAGRQFASAAAMQAAANGDQFTKLADISTTPTFLKTAYLQNHLDTTAPLLDFETADRNVRNWRDSYAAGTTDKLSQGAVTLGQMGLKLFGAYHSAWKIGMLTRLGLLPRAQLDTGLRGSTTHGWGIMAQQGFRGVNNYLNAHMGKGIGDANTLTTSFMARRAADGLGDVVDNLQKESEESAAQIAARQAQIERANELADTFHTRQGESDQFSPTAQMYAQKEQEARGLSTRLAGNTTTVGGEQPLGLGALNAARDVLEPVRQQNIANLRDAQAAYLTPQSLTKQLTTTPVTHSHNGVMFTGAPTMSDLEAATLAHDLRDSNNVLSDLMMGSIDKGLYKQRVDLGNWSNNVEPQDVRWPEKYALAAHDFHGSYTAHRVLQERLDDVSKAPEAYLRSFLGDPAVQQEFKQATGGGSQYEFQRWLHDLTHSVNSLAPNEKFRQALLSGDELTPKDVNDLAPNVADRFPAYGPSFFHDAEPNVINKMIETSFKYLLDQPDIYLARVPYYVPLYQRNIAQLLPAYADAARDAGTLVDHGDGTYELPLKDAMDLHARARGRALNDVHRDMYDVSKTIGVTGVMRYVAPFFNPWLQAQQSWARLIYDDPKVWGKLLRYSQTPDMFHLTVDQNGKQVNPWDGTIGMDKRIQVPLFGIGGLRNVGLTVGSFNVIIQGNTPFSPGFGPLVQVPAQAIVADLLPHVMSGKMYDWFLAHPENPVNQLLFPRPGDIPKSDMKSLAGDILPLPSWAKQASDVIAGDQGFGNTYTNAFATRYNYGIAQWRQQHGGADPTQKDLLQIKDESDSAARAAAFSKMVSSFALGLSGNAQPIGQYYVDKMHALVASTAQLHAMGTTPEQVFAQNFPSAANLNWSFSQNRGNLEATVNATSDYLRYKNTMSAHPDVMWWVAGPQNLVNAADPNGQFSGSAYNTQLNQGLRTKLSADDIMKQDQIAMGAGRWNSFKQAMRLYMTSNGITSLHAGNAGDLAGLQARYEEQLRQQFPDWAAHVDATNIGGGRDQEINQIKDIISNPPSPDFLQRPDVQMTQQYLMARDALVHEAQANNVTNWQTAASMEPERAALYAYGYQMATSDLVFHQAWTKLFEGEFYKDINAAKDAAASQQSNATTLGQTPVGGQ